MEICEQRFAWITKYGITTRHMNQHQFLFAVFFHATFKYENRRSSKEWKEIGTSASLAGRCCNADDRIINYDIRCECVYCSIGACYCLS